MPLSAASIAEPMRARLAQLAETRGDPERIVVHEVYTSIQGESTYAGLPCTFVRTTGCHLRCRYCDTEHSFHAGSARNVDELVSEVVSLAIPLVEVTGGEPLLQRAAHTLIARLCDAELEVLVETSGGVSTRSLDARAICILDVKTPGSGEADANVWRNLERLRPRDEVKFVLTSRGDYDWMRGVLERTSVHQRNTVLAGCAFGELEPSLLAAWIVADRLPIRFQLQLHKHVWAPDARGV